MVNLSDDTKERFDRLQKDDMTQSEFVSLLLDHYELTDKDGQPDVGKVLDRLDEFEAIVGSKSELGSYRGAQEAIDERLQK
jgi:hypothetical protein